jgi:uncharacterized protein
MAEPQDKGSMTVQEAGRKGGEKVAKERGSEFYSRIGRKGGQAVSQDRQHMSQIGQKGGQAGGRARARKKATAGKTDESYLDSKEK